MKNVLFVCQANVGRSQMAEAFFNFHTGTKNARSAGVEDFREKYNFRPTLEIVQTMQEKGIDISHQRMDFLTPEMCEDSDLIVVLCDRKLCSKFLLHHARAIYREVEDPFWKDPATVSEIRDKVEEVVLEVLPLAGAVASPAAMHEAGLVILALAGRICPSGTSVSSPNRNNIILFLASLSS